MAIGMPTNPMNPLKPDAFKPSLQRVQFGGSSGPSSPRANQKQQAQDVFQRSASASEPDAVQKQLAEADRMLPQLTQVLSDIEHGKPVKPIQLPEGNPFKARFEHENAALKARQAKAQREAAQKCCIEDTPKLRAALLEYGAVADEAELEAFMAKFGVKPQAE